MPIADVTSIPSQPKRPKQTDTNLRLRPVKQSLHPKYKHKHEHKQCIWYGDSNGKYKCFWKDFKSVWTASTECFWGRDFQCLWRRECSDNGNKLRNNGNWCFDRRIWCEGKYVW